MSLWDIYQDGYGTVENAVSGLLTKNGYNTTSLIQNTQASGYTVGSLTSWVSYGFTPQNLALQAAGNPADGSPDIGAVPVVTNITDTEAPSVPKNLTAYAVFNTQIFLRWLPAADNVKVAGYYVYRNNVEQARVHGPRFADYKCSVSTEYEYRVAAFDEAGNVGGSSETIVVETTNNENNNDQILGREYERALCIAKFAAQGGWDEIGNNSALYELGGDYHRLLTGNTFVPLITEISLGSAEVAILVKHDALSDTAVILESSEIIQIESIFPNPLYTESLIRLIILAEGNYKVDIYNITGQYITNLHNGEFTTGQYDIRRDGTNAGGSALPNGTYIIKISTGNYFKIGKIVVLK